MPAVSGHLPLSDAVGTPLSGVVEDTVFAVQPEAVVHIAVPAYHEWLQTSPAKRRAFLAMRPLHYASFTAADFGARSVDFVRKELGARLP